MNVSAARRVLLVDDVPQILTVLSALGRRLKAPCDFVTCTDPREALKFVSSEKFALVVSDFRMPHVDGVEILTRACRTNAEGCRVLMTGYNELPVETERLEGACVDAYLKKPMAAHETLILLWRLLATESLSLLDLRNEARQIEANAGTWDCDPRRKVERAPWAA